MPPAGRKRPWRGMTGAAWLAGGSPAMPLTGASGWYRSTPRAGQWLKSSCIGFFQLPWMPERVSRLGQWRLRARALQQSSRPGTFTGADLQRYREAWSQPQALRAMLNWYRAAVRKAPRLPVHRPITVPTLLIWGAQDSFLGREMA